MKTALVTGSAGFIGRHMVRELQNRGYWVEGLDISGKAFNWFGEDWYDANELFGRPEDEDQPRFDLVVHAAYHVGGRAAIDGTNTNFAKNLQLDAAMFEWAVRTNQTRVLYFSSSAAYPVAYQTKRWVSLHGADPADVRLHEDDIDLTMGQDCWENAPTYPDASYGWAKLTGERLAEDARRNGLAVSVVRTFSGYGEDQNPNEYPFPAIVDRARRGDLTVWGPPGQSRDWIHVDDVVRGALAVVDSATTDPVNLCTGVATEMGELACMVRNQYEELMGEYVTGPPRPEDHVDYLEDKPTGVFSRVGDPTRMLQYYQPKVSLEEGIRRALAS